jgi:murein DD-endopeptidase MepM/ murein hydrolase activator NlpD
MILPRRMGLTLALTLSLAAAAIAGCVARKAPPAPVITGQSSAPRAGTVITPPVAVASAPITIIPSPGIAVSRLPAAPLQPVETAELAPAMAATPAPPSASLPPPERHADAAPVPSGSTRRVPPHPDHVTVQAGETLYAISRRYGVPVRALIEANGLAPPYALSVGRRLAVPQVRVHLVQAGETLYSVSRAYGIDTTTLARNNDLSAPYTVFVGQALVLPTSTQVVEGVAPPPGPKPQVADARPPAPPRIEPAAGPASHRELAALPPPRVGSASGRFLWPVRGRLVSDYGTDAGGTRNDGINIAAPAGTTVLAAAAGVVAYAGNELRGYGNLVLIKHANGWMTAYAHNSVLLVKRGQKVRRGQPIARIGATGAVSRPQLHFEVRHGTKALDPTDYLPPGGTTSASGSSRAGLSRRGRCPYRGARRDPGCTARRRGPSGRRE